MSDVLGNALLRLSASTPAVSQPGTPMSKLAVSEPVASDPVAMQVAADTVVVATASIVAGRTESAATITFSPIEDGSLGQVTTSKPAATVGNSALIDLLRSRIFHRRRQFAAVVVLLVMGGLWYSDGDDQSRQQAAADFSDVEQMLADFDTASGSQQPLREPAEPIETNAWGDVATSSQATTESFATNAASSAPQGNNQTFFSNSPLTSSGEAGDSLPATSATAAVHSRAVADPTSARAETQSGRAARFTGRIQPLR